MSGFTRNGNALLIRGSIVGSWRLVANELLETFWTLVVLRSVKHIIWSISQGGYQ